MTTIDKEITKATIAKIEQHMVTRLSVQNDKRRETNQNQSEEPSPLPVVRSVEGYGGQFDSEESIAQAMQKAPAMWVTYEGETSILKGETLVRQINMAVFVMVTSYDDEELRLGSKAGVGLYQLIEIAREDLTNQTCGLDMSPLQLNSVTPLWRGGPEGSGFSLAVLRFATEVYSEAPADPTVLCDEPLYVADWKVGVLEANNVFKPWERETSSDE
jgi:phage gp37-like protein